MGRMQDIFVETGKVGEDIRKVLEDSILSTEEFYEGLLRLYRENVEHLSPEQKEELVKNLKVLQSHLRILKSSTPIFDEESP